MRCNSRTCNKPAIKRVRSPYTGDWVNVCGSCARKFKKLAKKGKKRK